MDQTPRLRSAFPQSPGTTRRSAGQYGGSPFRPQRRGGPPPSTIPTIAPAKPQPPSDPIIPEHVLDAPTQRLFVAAFAVALWSLRFYDWSTLNESEEQSLWLFMKWLAIDGIFLFGLPGLRIPWLEWSPSTMTMLFFAHAIADGMLMFRIPIPLGAGVAAVGRSFWGVYEMAVNERSVNPESVRFNESLILGRQIIHILPEGSAELNPGREAYCIDQSRVEIKLPIKINSTNPIAMELLRTDLDTQKNETIHISKSQIKVMHKDASRLLSYSDNPNEPKTLYFPIKKPGLYVLAKVMDESNLEVSRKRLAHTVIVPCPKAKIVPTTSDRCKGDLSKLEMEVVGTPPLMLTYRKVVNRVPLHATYENIVPDEFSSPFARQDQSALVLPNKIDTSWARSQTIVVPLSENLDKPGTWTYSIDEVQDAFGNKVVYTAQNHGQQKGRQLHQAITVHERPTVSLHGCSPQHPLKAAKGDSKILPVQYGSTGRGDLQNSTYELQYIYLPQRDVSANGEALGEGKLMTFTRRSPHQQPRISQAGLYTLTGVSTEHCKGEVMEPASCLLQNPPEPSLNLTSTEMSDKCAGRPIGLRVDLDLIGTPPFEIRYRMRRQGDAHHNEGVEKIVGSRDTMELKPNRAGLYTYEFLSISDAVYKNRPLRDIKLEQDVKPSALAGFVKLPGQQHVAKQIACIEDTASFQVGLSGQGPFKLEYELVHGGRREKYVEDDLEQERFEITTKPLREGGEYTLALVSITDAMGCKESLKDEARISVRHQKPKVGFRKVDGKFSISTVEKKNVQLPLRLEGDGPWAVKYHDESGGPAAMQAQGANDRISVSKAGTYELVGVQDATCPGVVDEEAKKFEVSWVPRPEMRFAPSPGAEGKGNTLVKSDVCEGEDDAVEVLFKGAPPFQATYIQNVKLDQRATIADQNKELRASTNMATIRMDTKLAGTYSYRFTNLKDANYDPSAQHFSPLTVQQKVHARPSAAFTSPNKNYKFCSSASSAGEEVIPLTLRGSPPFDLELEIRHQSAQPETVVLTGITTSTYNLRIPHTRLHAGRSAIHLRRVSDSRHCVRSLDSTTPSVQISVHDAPTITPLESHSDFCVGDRLSFALAGVAPFTISYTFEGTSRTASVSSSAFRRLAEKPGKFAITAVSDSASACTAETNITRMIHQLPSVRMSRGKESYVDIHEGGSTEIDFEFGGTPPFEFTYTRSANTGKEGGKGVKGGRVLDMRSEVSEGHRMRVRVGEEGTYEVVSVKDAYCAYARPGVKVEGGRKLLGN